MPPTVEFRLGHIGHFQHSGHELSHRVNREIGASKRTIMMTNNMVQALNSLNWCVERFKASSDYLESLRDRVEFDELAHRYFGITMSNGQIDERHRHAVNGLQVSLDSAIWYSREIVHALVKQATELSEGLGKGSPPVLKASYHKIADESLWPPDEDFSDWLEPNWKKGNAPHTV